MSDYIKREDAIKVLCDACGNVACPNGWICVYYEEMQNIPAADVVERKTGEWISVNDGLPENGHEQHGSEPVMDLLENGGMCFSELEENYFGQGWFV